MATEAVLCQSAALCLGAGRVSGALGCPRLRQRPVQRPCAGGAGATCRQLRDRPRVCRWTRQRPELAEPPAHGDPPRDIVSEVTLSQKTLLFGQSLLVGCLSGSAQPLAPGWSGHLSLSLVQTGVGVAAQKVEPLGMSMCRVRLTVSWCPASLPALCQRVLPDSR